MAQQRSNKKFKWALDYNHKGCMTAVGQSMAVVFWLCKTLHTKGLYHTCGRDLCRNSLSIFDRTRVASTELPSPPGYSQSAGVSHIETSKETDSNLLLIKKLWDVALGPLKQVPMNLFIMYMAGNSISIFPIMMVGMLIVRPVKAMFSTQSTFKMVEGTQAAGQKFVYFIGNVVNILLALYKCQSMGLLPTHASDWLAFEEPQTRVEHIGGGISLL